MSRSVAMLAAALQWWDAGCSVVVVRADGSKAPLGEWHQYQQARAARERVAAWFAAEPPGIGVVCGASSGGLEMLELEGRAIREGLGTRVVELAENAGLSPLWRRLALDGYAERTPSGGVHLLYRIADGVVPRNMRLARRPATGAELASDPTDRIKVLAETRGEGGVTVVAPSHGPVHPTGRPWVALAGSVPARIPTITTAQREALVTVVRQLDAMPPPVKPTPRRVPVARGGLSPGDDYERQTDWADILLPAGWTLVRTVGGIRYWRRPGKGGGTSASTGRAEDRDRLYVWSTSTLFEPEVPITKFHAFALLQFSGDHAAAAAALRHAGFGSHTNKPSPVTEHPSAEADTTRPNSIDDRVSPAMASTRVVQPPPHVATWGPSEDGLARALVAHHGHELRYCPQRGRWLVWTGYRWLWDEAERHREYVRALARQLPSGEGWWRFRARALSAAGVSGIARMAQTDRSLTVQLGELDAHPYELNTPAGIVDLRSGDVRAPDPARLHTRSTEVAPDFDRPSDVLAAFLADTFEPELAVYVQRLLGLSAIGAVLEQLLPFLHGTGANGKSTLLEAAMHALGRGSLGYAIVVPSDMLMVRKHAEHPVELAQLAGARMVVCSELEPEQRFAESRIKSLTGNDSINARFMRRDPFVFVPSHTLWLAGNHRPDARVGGPAFWRRVRLLPFTRSVPAERQDRRLSERFAQDAAAVLAWIVRGAADYHADGLREPAVVRAATRQYARDQDTVARFVEECCRLAPGQVSVRVGTTALRESYERWCEEAGEDPVSAKRLTQELRDRFGVADGKGAKGRRFYVGVELARDEE